MVHIIIYICFAVLALVVITDRHAGTKAKLLASRLTAFTGKNALLLITVFTLIYAAVSFINLGNIKSPQTYSRVMDETKEYVFDFGETDTLSYLMMMLGKNADTLAQLEISDDGESWTVAGDGEMPDSAQFRWVRMDIGAQQRYLKLTVAATHTQIHEIGFFDAQAMPLNPRLTSGDSTVCDEQALVPVKSDFMNGTYFDEYFYVTIGYDILHGYHPYDEAHPPLASELIAVGMAIFGVSPFGWRFMAVLFGIAMIPLIYMFALKMLRSKNLALLAAFLLGLDFLHFVQSRVAVIEVFMVFFLLLAFYFLYGVYRQSREREGSVRLSQFLLTGLSLGLASACKWNGFFGVITALILCVPIFINEYKKTRRRPLVFVLKSVLISILCLLVLPLLIYVLSYVPVMMQEGKGIGYLYDVHFRYVSEHLAFTNEIPFASLWYEWIVVKTPFPYYNDSWINAKGSLLSAVISCMGSPLLWWLFIPALAGIAVIAVRDKGEDGTGAQFLLISAGLLLVPWLVLGRTMFIYYFFMHLPFLILALCLCVKQLLRRGLISARPVLLFAGLTAICFVMYYPILSGVFVDPAYIQRVLKALGSWAII